MLLTRKTNALRRHFADGRHIPGNAQYKLILLTRCCFAVRPTQAVRALGGVPGLVKADLDPLLRRLDTIGDGRVSLPDLMEWGERPFLSAAAVENAVSTHKQTGVCSASKLPPSSTAAKHKIK